MKKTTSGFTLVELLIVIVVIAILAAISVVAYNGINDRAHNSSLAVVVDSYRKHFEMTWAENGKFKSAPGTLFFQSCIGDQASYPASGVFPAGVCVMNVASNTPVISVDSTFYSETTARFSSIPKAPTDRVVTIGTQAYRGVWVVVSPLDYYQIETAIPPSRECPANLKNVQQTSVYIWCDLRVERPNPL